MSNIVASNGVEYDLVYAFFLSRTKNNKDVAKNLTASLFEVCKNLQLDPVSVITEFKKYQQDANFKAVLVALFNEGRQNTSKLGFNRGRENSPLVVRNIRD